MQMPVRRRAITTSAVPALPLCPDCKIEMEYQSGGPLSIASRKHHFELICPNCRKKLSELLLSPKRPQGSKEAYPPDNMIEKLKKIIEEFDRLPVLDGRSPDEILGYDEHGVPQ